MGEVGPQKDPQQPLVPRLLALEQDWRELPELRPVLLAQDSRFLVVWEPLQAGVCVCV